MLMHRLETYGRLIPFSTSHKSYAAISCHPDIFMFQSPDALILSPDFPEEIIRIFKNNAIPFIMGKSKTGLNYPESAAYNAFADDDILVYSKKATDAEIVNTCTQQQKIAVNQAYIRCNMIRIGKRAYVTSDMGIHKALQQHGLGSWWFSPAGIRLTGFEYGFLGGCMGYYNDCLFISGSLDYYPEGNKLRNLLQLQGQKYLELTNEALSDGGGIFFITPEGRK